MSSECSAIKHGKEGGDMEMKKGEYVEMKKSYHQLFLIDAESGYGGKYYMGMHFLNDYYNDDPNDTKKKMRHTCPNVLIKDYLIIARVDIDCGTELLTDYHGRFKEK